MGGLIALSLSLGVFTASMARTLDDFAYDRARYSTGADVVLTDLGEALEGDGSQPGAAGSQADNGQPNTTTAPDEYLFTPVDDFLTLPGVEAVSRVGRSDVFVVSGNAAEPATFLGVDRASLPAVLGEAWRRDYADESLGALMNRLASDPAALLVSRAYATEQGLNPGDRVELRMSDLGTSVETSFVVAGYVDYFPTLYREVGPYFIGNLDHSIEVQGGPYPYEAWISTTPATTGDEIQIASVARGWNTRLHQSPAIILDEEIRRPERQGVIGVLSAGFLAASIVTILGVLAHTALAYRRRLVELSTLRALGLSRRQLLSVLLWEQGLVIGFGTLIGTGFGILASRLFMPFFKVRSGSFPDTPPFLPKIAWHQIGLIYGVTTLLLLSSVALIVLLVSRSRLFENVKLGEAL